MNLVISRHEDHSDDKETDIMAKNTGDGYRKGAVRTVHKHIILKLKFGLNEWKMGDLLEAKRMGL
ncbi:hypothetical protein ABES02_26665 [Neobacillus pocheonensis]|uniref:hypothetical protein n=1 Tax=Neobacillus pocheonensis TaxID=363869 RepID=UPI003D2AB659